MPQPEVREWLHQNHTFPDPPITGSFRLKAYELVMLGSQHLHPFPQSWGSKCHVSQEGSSCFVSEHLAQETSKLKTQTN